MHTSALLSRSWVGPVFVALCAFSTLLSLGFWQLSRKEWKEAIIMRIGQQVASDPLSLPPSCHWNGWETKIGEYRHVTIQGKFLHHKELLFHAPSSLDSGSGATPGFFVLTPLEQNDGSIVIINRGFIPISQQHSGERYTQSHDGPITLVGLTRGPQKRGWLMPENTPTENAWFVQDPHFIAQTQGLKNVAPFLIDLFKTKPPTPLSGWPLGRNKIPFIPNDHLGYALTWFALAGSLVVIFAFWMREQHTKRKNSQVCEV